MDITHFLIGFGVGFAAAALLWIRAFRRLRTLVGFYTSSANQLALDNAELRARCDKLDAALIRRDQILRESVGAPDTIQALIFKQILSNPGRKDL